MKRQLCRHGETRPGTVNIPLERGGRFLIVKGVPSEVCDARGEFFLPETVTVRLENQAGAAWRNPAEVQIIHYTPAS